MLLSRLVGFVCERNAQALVLADSSGIAANKSSTQTDLTTSALMILSEINRKYSAEMKFNGLQIMVNEKKNKFFFLLLTNLPFFKLNWNFFHQYLAPDRLLQ